MPGAVIGTAKVRGSSSELVAANADWNELGGIGKEEGERRVGGKGKRKKKGEERREKENIPSSRVCRHGILFHFRIFESKYFIIAYFNQIFRY